MQKFKQWVEEITHNASSREISRALDINHVTVTRHINNENVQFCIDLARAYNANPLRGLLACDAITKADIQEMAKTALLDDLDDLELAEEIVRRLQERQDSELANVTEFPRRSNNSEGDVRPVDYAADTSPDEPMPGDDDYSDGP